MMNPALLRSLYAVCLLAGASTHAWTIAKHGLAWDYDGAPMFSRVYWTSLVIFDTLGAALLFLKPRAGVALAIAIISTDVAHNTWLMSRSPNPDWTNWMYLMQLMFFLLVLATAKRAWGTAARS